MNQLPPQFNDLLKKNFLLIEVAFLLAIILGLYLKSIETEAGSVILAISIGVIAVLYYLGAFIKTEFSTGISLIENKVLYVSWAVFAVGFLFKIQQLPGFGSMLLIGTATMCISFLVLLLKNISSWSSDLTYALLRTVVMASIFAYFTIN